MAKSKKQKKSKPKTKAVVKPAIQPSNESAIPALSKLSSSEPNDQLWAVTTLSNLIQQPENIEQLVQGRIVEKLLNVIGDIDTELNFEALGALRNTLTVVGHSACIELLALGGMSKLLNLIPKMVSYIIGKETPTLALDYNLALEQILSSLWCLGETSEEAVAFLTSTDLISLLVDMLTTSTAPPYLRRTSGQCLNTLSESNQLFLNILQGNRPILERVLRFLNAEDGMTWENEKIELALLCGFILVNVKALLSDDELASVQSYCFRLIEIASVYDVAAQYKKVEVAGKAIENLDVNSASQSLEAANAVQKLLAPISPEQLVIDSSTSHLSIIQLSLELLTNIYAQDDDADSDDVILDDDYEYQWSPVLQNNLEIFFLRKIYNLTELKECILSPVACKTFCSNVLAVKTRALTALANIFLVPSTWLENNTELATSWWNSFANGALSVSNMDPIPIDLFEAYVACIWSFTRLLLDLQLKLNVPLNFVQWMTHGLQDMQIPEKTKVKMTGILSYTAITTADIEINRYIGLFFVSFLQDSCQNMFEAEVTREMIEGLMDIYSDNAFFYDNPVFVAHGFQKSLEAIKSQLRSKFKQNYQIEPEVKEYCLETLNTFSEFLDYKREEQTQVLA